MWEKQEMEMTLSPPNPVNTIVVIPARMTSNGLPGKPLADICGSPMVVRAWQCAKEAKIGKVLVAAGNDEIVAAVRQAGGDAIRTDNGLATSHARVAQAVTMRDPDKAYQYIVNLPASMPVIEPKSIRACLGPFLTHETDLATLVSEISSEMRLKNNEIIKVITAFSGGASTALASDFIRQVPDETPPPFWQHAGVFAFRRQALESFIQRPPSARESSRKIDLMRALDNNMTIGVSRIDKSPFKVNTIADLERVRAAFEK
jgi:3-deoxy-manno-octulosonate cytidylyltransferase (CMP-KDO synthetase)